MKTLLSVLLGLSVSTMAAAAGNISLQPGQSVTLTPGEPVTATCQSVNPSAKSCTIKYSASCSEAAISLRITDENGDDFLGYCFTLASAMETLSQLRAVGQCQ